MKTKLIETKISKIINEFYFNFFKYYFKKIYNSNEDHIDEYQIFLNDIKKSTFIAGGSIANMLLNKKVKDFDIFIDDDKIRNFIIEYCILIGKEQCNGNFDYDLNWSNKFGCFFTIKDSNRCEQIPKFESFDDLNKANEYYNILFYLDFNLYSLKEHGEFQISFSKNAITIVNKENVFQFIIFKTFNRIKLDKYFDFIHTTNYFDLATNKLCTNQDALISILNKDLKYLKSNYPIISLIRLKKFEKSGWSINNIELFKICNDISKLKLKNKIDYINAFCGCSNLTYIEILSILEKYSFIDEIDFNDFIEKMEDAILNK